MARTLVAYFSATGTTKKLAERLAGVLDAGLFEIEPAEPYSLPDLDWTNRSSRSTVEMNDPASRPAITGDVGNLSDYDTVFLGFPVWWYTAPHIVNTFVERNSLDGKVVVPFCTSGSSGYGNCSQTIRKAAPKATWLPGTRLEGNASERALRKWVDELNL